MNAIGWSFATDSMKTRTEKNSSSRSSTEPSGSRPSRIARCAAICSSPTLSRSFASPTSVESLSKIPQSCLTWLEKAK